MGHQRGQATIELALLLPFVAVLAGFLVEIGALATDQVRLWHAAREAARVATVDSDEAAIRKAADSAGLGPMDLEIDPRTEARVQGSPITVEVRYRPSATVPVIGMIFQRTVIAARATMRIEQP